jgi:hypothetical protein
MLELIERRRVFSRQQVLDLVKELMCQERGSCPKGEKSNG